MPIKQFATTTRVVSAPFNQEKLEVPLDVSKKIEVPLEVSKKLSIILGSPHAFHSRYDLAYRLYTRNAAKAMQTTQAGTGYSQMDLVVKFAEAMLAVHRLGPRIKLFYEFPLEDAVDESERIRKRMFRDAKGSISNFPEIALSLVSSLPKEGLTRIGAKLLRFVSTDPQLRLLVKSWAGLEDLL